jgi:hypothetical protein
MTNPSTFSKFKHGLSKFTIIFFSLLYKKDFKENIFIFKDYKCVGFIRKKNTVSFLIIILF